MKIAKQISKSKGRHILLSSPIDATPVALKGYVGNFHTSEKIVTHF